MPNDQPLRNPVGPNWSDTPVNGMLYVTDSNWWLQYANGAWQDVRAGKANMLGPRTLTLTGGATGSVTTDWGSDPTLYTWVGRDTHSNESVPMVALQTSDNYNSVPQNTWTCLSFNTNHCNDNNMWDGGGTVYLNTPGYYLIVAMVRWNWDTDSGRRLSEIRVNNGWKWSKGYGATSSGEHARTMSVVAYSDGGSQNVQVWCYNESSGSNRAVFEAALAVWKFSR